MKRVLASFVVFFLLSCSSDAPEAEKPLPESVQAVLYGCPEPVGRPRKASISEITADPGAFHGVLVHITGHYHRSFEHHAIYPGPAPEPDEHTFEDGIWVLSGHDGLQGDHVEAVGYFTAKTRGHLGQWPGSLCVTSAAGAPKHAP